MADFVPKYDVPYNDLSGRGSAVQQAKELFLNRQNLEYPNQDRNDAAFAQYLQYLMHEEDFQRSSPEQQVQRLMAAGMSRAAALQALQGEQYTAAQPVIAGNAEQSKAAKMQAITNAIQAGVRLIQDITNIIQTIPAIQMNYQLAQQYPGLMQAQLQGYSATARIQSNQATLQDFEIASKQQYAKLETALQEYESDHPGWKRPATYKDLLSYMDSMTYDENDVTSEMLYETYKDGQILGKNNPLMHALMRRMYNEDYMDSWSNSVERKLADNRVKMSEVDLEHTSQLISESISRMLENYAQQAYDAQLTELAKMQVLETLHKIGYIDAQTYEAYQQGDSAWFDGMLKSQEYALRQFINPVAVQEALIQYKTLSELPSEYYKNNAMRMLYDSRAGMTTAFISAALAFEGQQMFQDNGVLRVAGVLSNFGLTDTFRGSQSDKFLLFGHSSEGVTIPGSTLQFNQNTNLFGVPQANQSQDNFWNQFKRNW